jgi:ferredoxin
MVKALGNRESCRGYGNCLIAAPKVFDVDDDGLVIVLKDDVSAEELSAVERAAYDCPTNSITIESDAAVEK